MATVYMLHGYLGAGKTTYAKALEAKGTLRFSPDEDVVARYGANPPSDDHGMVEDDIKARIWTKVATAVAGGRDVVLDFGFWRRRERDEARRRIGMMGATAVLVKVACADAVARARVMERNGKAGEIAMDLATFDALKARLEPLEADEACVVVEG